MTPQESALLDQLADRLAHAELRAKRANLLDDAAGAIKSRWNAMPQSLGEAAGAVKGRWNALPERAQTGLMGAGVGGALGLGSALLSPDERSRKNWANRTLVGALGGGAVGAAVPELKGLAGYGPAQPPEELGAAQKVVEQMKDPPGVLPKVMSYLPWGGAAVGTGAGAGLGAGAVSATKNRLRALNPQHMQDAIMEDLKPYFVTGKETLNRQNETRLRYLHQMANENPQALVDAARKGKGLSFGGTAESFGPWLDKYAPGKLQGLGGGSLPPTEAALNLMKTLHPEAKIDPATLAHYYGAAEKIQGGGKALEGLRYQVPFFKNVHIPGIPWLGKGIVGGAAAAGGYGAYKLTDALRQRYETALQQAQAEAGLRALQGGAP